MRVATDSLSPGHHRHVAHALGTESRHDAFGVRSQLVGHHDHPGQVTVDSYEHVCLAGAVSRHQCCGGNLVGVVALGWQEGAAANRHAVAVEAAGDPLAGILPNVAGHFDGQLGVLRGAHERLAEDVGG
jgi:hypothetical protein